MSYETDPTWARKNAQSRQDQLAATQEKLATAKMAASPSALVSVTTAHPNYRLSYSHEALIDLIIADPAAKPAHLAEQFSVSAGWMMRILASDSFNSRLAARKHELLDPHLSNLLDERVRSVTLQSLDVLSERLAEEGSAVLALETLGALFVGEISQRLGRAGGAAK